MPAVNASEKAKKAELGTRIASRLSLVRVFIRDLIKTVHPALSTHIQNEIRTFDFRCFPI